MLETCVEHAPWRDSIGLPIFPVNTATETRAAEGFYWTTNISRQYGYKPRAAENFYWSASNPVYAIYIPMEMW
jgi:hypothetical protein